MFKKIINLFRSIVIRISLALYETENEILRADILDGKPGTKMHQRKRHRNNLLEKFLAGQKDEKYTQDYYEVLKKADKFMKEASEHKIAVAADRHGMNYALKDKWGRRYEHLGFYDEKHKHSGKTIAEVLVIEYEDRKTKDDHYELLNIYDNSPVEVGLVDIMSTVERVDKESIDFEFQVNDMIQHSKKFRFPIRCSRENQEILNKIEQLTESLHVKKIGFEYVQLEFFIPLKFGTDKLTEDSKIFQDLINITQVFINDDYGNLIGYGVTGFKKRIIHKEIYEVLKFDGIKMATIKQY